MELIAHRGCMAEVPQNTLNSFEAAIRQGAKMIELDVVICKTGEIIIFHDDDVETITRGQVRGAIDSFTFEELRQFNVHDGFNDGNFYQIPTLQELLELVKKLSLELGYKTRTNIELKGPGTALPVSIIIEEYMRTKEFISDDIIVSSFRHDELKTFKQLLPDIEIAVLLGDDQWEMMGKSCKDAIELTKSLGGTALNPCIDFVSAEMILTCHQAGLRVNVWTIKTQEEYNRMKVLEVDAVFVNTQKLEK